MFKHQYSIRSNTHKGTVQLWGELVLLRSSLPWTVVLLVREMLPFLHSHRLNSRDKQIVKWFLHQPLGIHRRHELTKLFSLCPLKKGVSVSNWEKKIYAQKHLQTCICMNKLVILIPLKDRRRKERRTIKPQLLPRHWFALHEGASLSVPTASKKLQCSRTHCEGAEAKF